MILINVINASLKLKFSYELDVVGTPLWGASCNLLSEAKSLALRKNIEKSDRMSDLPEEPLPDPLLGKERERRNFLAKKHFKVIFITGDKTYMEGGFYEPLSFLWRRDT
jgi:hypothetical protein